jgi:hypothetical protein
MVLTVGAGSSDYAFAMSTAKTGATGSESPDGTAVYLFPKKYGFVAVSKDRRRVISNFSSSMVLSGKYDLGIRLTNVIVTAVVKATGVEEVDYVRDFIRTYGSKVGSDKVYAFLHNAAANKDHKCSWDSSHTQVQYMEGRPMATTWENAGGDMFMAPSFVFYEVTI